MGPLLLRGSSVLLAVPVFLWLVIGFGVGGW